MKREFLAGLELTKDQIDKVMEQYGMELGAIKSSLNERANYSDYEDIKKQKEILEKKLIEKDIEIKNTRYESALTGFKFSSNSAKKSFLADLKAKDLEIEDGQVKGLDEFVRGYKEADPQAFLVEQKEEKPQITKGLGENLAPNTNYFQEKYGNSPFYRKK